MSIYDFERHVIADREQQKWLYRVELVAIVFIAIQLIRWFF